jgi:hypothetical protein
MEAAHHLWGQRHGERIGHEMLAEQEEQRKISPIKLYQTGPDCKGREMSPYDRDASMMEAVEARLTSGGFVIKVEGGLCSYVKRWKKFAIYADPRRASSIAFNIYERRRLRKSITVRDVAKDLSKTLQAKLRREIQVLADGR